jgi:hypothetical protein
MTRRKAVLAACGVIVGAVAVAAAPEIAWDPMHRPATLTFNRAVGLPGVTLEPGTYVFELANPESGNNVVRVRGRDDYRQVYYTGFTHMVERPASLGDRPVLLGEAVAGKAVPILAWYPRGEQIGRQFIYPR